MLLRVDLLIELQYLKIGGRNIRNDLQVSGAPIGLSGMELGRLPLNTLLDLTPDIDIPGDPGTGVVLLAEC